MNILRTGGGTGSENRLSFYILKEKKPLALLTITGLIYNLGLTAGPYFEGQLVQCLKNIYEGSRHCMICCAWLACMLRLS